MIFPHPSAPLGSVTTLPSYSTSSFPLHSTILCRTNAPLVSFAFALLRRKIQCCVLGRDIAAGIIGTVKRLRATSIPDLQTKLDTWYETELASCHERHRSPERIEDYYNCIRNLAASSVSVDTLLTAVAKIFSDSGEPEGRITLSTIHKAKGLEYPTVFLLDRNLIPSKYATSPEQKEQERNLLYVAVTRAMSELYYISSDCWTD